jgi:polysaccharide pyruvyl transferase WcaK-like protein
MCETAFKPRLRTFFTSFAGPDMKIGLFGLFGCGNTGNDASLEAMILFLRRAMPQAELVCLCPNPEIVSKTFGIAAVNLNWRAADHSIAAMLDKMMAGIPRRVLGFTHAFNEMASFDILIVPGTGFLDDFQDGPFGWPLVILRWFAAAKLSGSRIAMVSIGAGPIRHPLSRRLMKAAARMADYRSYRDDESREFMAGLNLDVSDDPVYPDVVFSLPVPAIAQTEDASHLTVGVGVMSYFGWSKYGGKGEAIYQTYLDLLAEFVDWLLSRGFGVRLVTGDDADWHAVTDLRQRIARQRRSLAVGQLEAEKGSTLQDLMTQLAGTDMAVVTRFHNVVAAIKLGLPLISLGYSSKNDNLMAEAGLGAFCQSVESLDLDLLKHQFDELLAQRLALTAPMCEQNALFRERLAVQQDKLLSWIKQPPLGELPQSKVALGPDPT